MKKIPVSVFVKRQVDKAISALPTPSKARDGAPGKPGRDGKDGTTTVINKEVLADVENLVTMDILQQEIEELEKKLGQLEADLRTRLSTRATSGGGYPADLDKPLANFIVADQASNVITVDQLDKRKLNIVHVTSPNATVTLPKITTNYIVWVEDAVTGGGNIIINRET